MVKKRKILNYINLIFSFLKHFGYQRYANPKMILWSTPPLPFPDTQNVWLKVDDSSMLGVRIDYVQARLWVQVIHELRSGLKLKKTEYTKTPIGNITCIHCSLYNYILTSTILYLTIFTYNVSQLPSFVRILFLN